MKSAVHFGVFNAEALLDVTDCYVQLPAIVDRDAEKIIGAMDELLFPLCIPEDLLLTRYAIPAVQKQYLESITFRFQCNAESVATTYSDNNSLISLLIDEKSRKKYRSIFTESIHLSPYAQIPEIECLCDCYNISFRGPSVSVMKRVSSKIYSHTLHDILGIPRHSERITNIEELRKAAERFSGSKFLLKYPYGVSGKGNLLIQSGQMFERIVRYLTPQIKKGKSLELLVEPFLNKMIDFSCQMNIDSDGRCTILSVQKMENNAFAYWGSSCADSDLYALLEKNDYFDLMQKIGSHLFTDGYFGFVCVDSMLLKDFTLVPIVEINARKSMGLINHSLNERLRNDAMKSHLRFLSVGIRSSFSYEKFIEQLGAAGLLYRNIGEPGILPLASNTLSVNRDAYCTNSGDDGTYNGRFYFSGAAPDVETANNFFSQLRVFLRHSDICVYN